MAFLSLAWVFLCSLVPAAYASERSTLRYESRRRPDGGALCCSGQVSLSIGTAGGSQLFLHRRREVRVSRPRSASPRGQPWWSRLLRLLRTANGSAFVTHLDRR